MKSEPKQGWQIGMLRATAFVNSDVKEPVEIWKNIVGKDPDEVINDYKKSVILITGEMDGPEETIKLSCQTAPGRVDLLFRPIDDASFSGLPVIGRLLDDIDKYRSIISSFFMAIPEVYRLAFGPVIIQEVDDISSGNKELQKYLHSVKIDPDNSKDLFYQINRTRKVKIEDSEYLINRLSKWNVIEIATATIHKVIGKNDDPVVKEEQIYFACRLEMDINNLPDPAKVLSPETIEILSNSFIDYAIDIAQNGDNP